MKGARGKLINLLTICSVLLCAAMGCLWVRSYHRVDGLGWTRKSSYQYSIVSNLGVLVFDRNNYAEYWVGYQGWTVSENTTTADDFFNDSSWTSKDSDSHWLLCF